MPAVTKHLKVLQKAGLIRQERRAQWRPCFLVAEPLKEASDWVDQYRKFWEESLDRLEVYLETLQSEQTITKRTKEKGKNGRSKSVRNRRS